MITQDNLNAKAGLYLRANGVLTNSEVKINDKPVKEIAADRGYTEGLINNIYTYFNYLDILAEYEAAQMVEISNGQTPMIVFDDKVRKVGNDGAVTFETVRVEEPFQPIFTMLPADEPRFKVNLNTRRIEVPSGFVGQQVQDDTFAETIWFEADRYFDAKDLYNTDISIQWENGKNKGITEAFNVTANLYVADVFGKIIFGWPLTNEVTKNSGNVRFSIRFYLENENGEVIYNLTTLPMILKINDGLILNKNATDVEKIQVHDNFYNNLKIKSFYTIIPAAMPELEKLYAEGNETSKIIDLKDGAVILMAKGKVEEPEDGSSRKGTLSYQWIRYIEDEEGKISLDQDFSEPKIIDINGEDYSQIEANIAGAYTVIISNYYGGDIKQYIPSYYIDAEEKIINAEELIQIPYAKYPEFAPITEKDLRIIVKRDNESSISFDLENNDNNTASYKWKYCEEEDGNYAWIDGVEEDKLIFNAGAFNEGWYKVEVTNHRNNTEKTATSDQSFIVTAPAQPYEIKSFNVSTDTYANTMNIAIADEGPTLIEAIGKTVINPVKGSNPNNIDSLTSYQFDWYKNEVAEKNHIDSNGELTINNDSEDGRYICRVTTIYNGNSTYNDYAVMIFY